MEDGNGAVASHLARPFFIEFQSKNPIHRGIHLIAVSGPEAKAALKVYKK